MIFTLNETNRTQGKYGILFYAEKKKINQCILYAEKHNYQNKSKSMHFVLSWTKNIQRWAERMLPILQLGVLLLDADWVKLVMWSRSIVPFLVAFSTWSCEKCHVKHHQDCGETHAFKLEPCARPLTWSRIVPHSRQELLRNWKYHHSFRQKQMTK